jgi:hypothetical protein
MRPRTASATYRSVRFSANCSTVTSANCPGETPGLPRRPNAAANSASANIPVVRHKPASPACSSQTTPAPPQQSAQEPPATVAAGLTSPDPSHGRAGSRPHRIMIHQDDHRTHLETINAPRIKQQSPTGSASGDDRHRHAGNRKSSADEGMSLGPAMPPPGQAAVCAVYWVSPRPLPQSWCCWWCSTPTARFRA